MKRRSIPLQMLKKEQDTDGSLHDLMIQAKSFNFKDWVSQGFMALEQRQQSLGWGHSKNTHNSTEIQHNEQLSNQYLYQPMQYMMDLPAKRIRPLLCILAYQAEKEVKPEDKNALLDLALSIEWLHNFTLAHDDIMDNAEKRRGKKALHIEYNQTTAILAGDALFAQSFLTITQAFPEKTHLLVPLFARTALEICEGQAEDIAFSTDTEIVVANYIEMIRKKTAILLGTSLEMGACAAGSKETELWYYIGERIGLAFQLRDDYLDVFGEETQTGKIKGGDILENKKTALWLYAFQQADAEQKEKLIYWQTHSGENKVNEVSQIFKTLKADTFVSELAQKNVREAQTLIYSLSCTKTAKIKLLSLLNYLENREK